jgi:hypothetical protein
MLVGHGLEGHETCPAQNGMARTAAASVAPMLAGDADPWSSGRAVSASSPR